LRHIFLLIPLAIAWLALVPMASGQLPPPAPDGGYPNNNTAEGTNALLNLTTGTDNTAAGFNALSNSTTGGFNTATGSGGLQSNKTGGENTASGDFVLFSNTTGFGNTATGLGALFGGFGDCAGPGGNDNTATGSGALFSNASGSNNTAGGFEALKNSTGSNNIALGSSAGINLTTGNNNIDIGALGLAGESDTIRIGRLRVQKSAYIQGISGATVATGVTVIVGSNGKLGTVQSSERFKDEIKPMDKASEAILALEPVTFRYRKELDPDRIPQFGLVAEQVEKVNPDLVARDENGQVHTVRYEAVNAMLLNEFLKEHRKVQEEEATIAQLKQGFAEQQKQIGMLTAQLKDQAAQIRQVNDKVETSSSASQMASTD
jgi:hypothetical protein